MEYSKKAFFDERHGGPFRKLYRASPAGTWGQRSACYDSDEKKQHDMRVFYRGRTNLSFVIGDVRNRDRLDEAMVRIGIKLHAAALKQVLACDSFPHEAIHTNVIGAQHVVDAVLRNCLKSFVMISTDKAVRSSCAKRPPHSSPSSRPSSARRLASFSNMVFLSTCYPKSIRGGAR